VQAICFIQTSPLTCLAFAVIDDLLKFIMDDGFSGVVYHFDCCFFRVVSTTKRLASRGEGTNSKRFAFQKLFSLCSKQRKREKESIGSRTVAVSSLYFHKHIQRKERDNE
jgi:hypothetical protein